MASQGAIWIAYGYSSLREASQSIQEYQSKTLPAFPPPSYARVALVCEEMTQLSKVQHVIREDLSFGARQSKVLLDLLTPYDHTVYMDADTRVKSIDILKGFNILKAGWDLVVAPSRRQGSDVFGHISQEEREYTFNGLRNKQAIQLQAGVMWFSNSPRVASLFDAWRTEWNIFKQHDQAALVRAIDKVPIKIWLLGKDWNSRRGAVVDHLFGRAIMK